MGRVTMYKQKQRKEILGLKNLILLFVIGFLNQEVYNLFHQPPQINFKEDIMKHVAKETIRYIAYIIALMVWLIPVVVLVVVSK